MLEEARTHVLLNSQKAGLPTTKGDCCPKSHLMLLETPPSQLVPSLAKTKHGGKDHMFLSSGNSGRLFEGFIKFNNTVPRLPADISHARHNRLSMSIWWQEIILEGRTLDERTVNITKNFTALFD